MKKLFAEVSAFCLLGISVSQSFSQVNVLTYHNDNARTGLNADETLLTPANVNSTSFGKLFKYNVDGYVYAQPLYVSALNIAGQGTHNVLFIATEHDSVYALEADSNTGPNNGVLWHVNLGTSAVTPNPDFGTRYNGGQYTDITNEVGITGTPVIDLPSGTLYVDAFTHEGSSYYHRIHALNITDGTERAFSPVLVSASVPGLGVGSVGGRVAFVPKQQIQRGALTLAGGILYVPYSGYADTDPFHGWLIGYDAATLQLLTNYVFNTTPNSTVSQFGANAGEAGIWMSGSGLAVDANTNLYLEVGNGVFTATNNSGGTEYGDTFLKMATTNGLTVIDYFAPYNQATLAANDTDLGSAGLILLPDQPGAYPHLLVGGGKEGKIYLVNRDLFTTNNNHYNSTGTVDSVRQIISAGSAGRSTGTPAYFNGWVYYGRWTTKLAAFALNNGVLSASPVSAGSRNYSFPGTTPIVSANGTSNGIVWALQMANPGVLVAHNATNLTNEIYNTTLVPGRDALTNGVKFTVPTVANGKVYVGSQYSVFAFGLLGGNLAFSSNNYAASESSGTATISVARTGGSQGAAQVSYATVPGGTATPGVDYMSTSGTLTWGSGDTSSKSFNVTLMDDNVAEGNETVFLVLSNASGAYLGSQATAILTIVEDGYETWKLSHFGPNANNNLVSGDYADPDGDGTPNLLEFALASDPNKPAADATISGALAANQFQLSLRRNTAATNLTYIVQAGSTLGAWSDLMTYTGSTGWVANTVGATASESSAVGTFPDAFVNVTVTDPAVVVPDGTSRFYRLLVHR